MVRRRHITFMVVGIAVLLSAASSAYAQGVVRGQVMDKWDNPIPNVQVKAVIILNQDIQCRGLDDDELEPREMTSNDDGWFFGRDFRLGGSYEITYEADGYLTNDDMLTISRGFDPNTIQIVLQVSPTGERFRGTRVYEAEGGIPKFAFEQNGSFTFTEADGKGEGTYGIVERTVVLVVRSYDGPDDKYPIAVPIEVPFYSSVFPSFTWEEVKLSVQ